MDMKEYSEIYDMLKSKGQEHLMYFCNELNKEDMRHLINQINNIDFDFINDLYKNVSDDQGAQDNNELNVSPIMCNEIKKMSEEEISSLENIGNDQIRKNKVCAVTVAGGQGTRLGHNGPKGTFSIGLPSGRSLFEILCDKLKKLCDENNGSIPWYIMTSTENNEETVSFFEANNYFGYPKEDIIFFIQGMLPVVDSNTGKILMKSKSDIVLGADGHGGVFKAMMTSGVLRDMDRRGIEYVFLCGIDNVLVQMASPLFIGFAVKEDTDCASKGIIKRDPYEKAGVFCYNNGKPAVIEYTELNDELRHARDEKDEYIYGDINILNYVFKFEVLNRIATLGLPYHTAHKKSSYIDKNGTQIKPDKENGYKFETFIFDAFSQLDSMSVLRGVREEEFAPVKNAEGEDSPATAKELLLAAGER